MDPSIILFQAKVYQVSRLKVRYDELQPVLIRLQQTTGSEGIQKLLDENQFLRDALQTLENQVSIIHSLCIEKQQAWKEFQLRFDTTLASFRHSIQSYEQNQDDLDRLKVNHTFSFLVLSKKIVFIGYS